MENDTVFSPQLVGFALALRVPDQLEFQEKAGHFQHFWILILGPWQILCLYG